MGLSYAQNIVVRTISAKELLSALADDQHQ